MSELVNISPHDTRSKEVKDRVFMREQGEDIMSEQFSQAVAAV